MRGTFDVPNVLNKETLEAIEDAMYPSILEEVMILFSKTNKTVISKQNKKQRFLSKKQHIALQVQQFLLGGHNILTIAKIVRKSQQYVRSLKRSSSLSKTLPYQRMEVSKLH